MRQRRSSRGLQTILFGVALLYMNVAVCWGVEQELPPLLGEPAHGRDLFIGKGCISCHAVRGSGGKVGPDLAAVLVGKGIIGIAAAMLNHYPKMSVAMHQKSAAVPHLDPGEMDDVVAYLLFINFAREPGSPGHGRLLFSEKGCIKCHWTRPDSKSPAPPLGQASLAAPPITIAQEMWNHGTQMNATMQQLQLERPVFEGHQMADVLAFLSGTTEPLVRGTLLPGNPVLGRDLFKTKGCARCHVKDEAGKSIGPNLSNGKWYMTATEIAGEMWNHGPAMWSLTQKLGITPVRFEDDELADVIAYLYLVRSAKGSEDAARGRELFSSKHCAQCHERGGPGPDLATVPQLDSPIHFAAEMWNHAPRMQTFVSHAGIDWPKFDADDVSDLVSYLRQRHAGVMN